MWMQCSVLSHISHWLSRMELLPVESSGSWASDELSRSGSEQRSFIWNPGHPNLLPVASAPDSGQRAAARHGTLDINWLQRLRVTIHPAQGRFCANNIRRPRTAWKSTLHHKILRLRSFALEFIQPHTGELQMQRSAVAGCSWHTLAQNYWQPWPRRWSWPSAITARPARSGVDLCVLARDSWRTFITRHRWATYGPL